MKTSYSAAFCSFIVVASAMAQTSGNPKQPTKMEVPLSKKPLNNRFTIAYPNSTKTWKVGNGQATSAAVSKTITNDLAQKLAQKKFLRVQTLDVQCCAIQFELLDVNSQMLSVRITVLDIDKQSVYTKAYSVESRPKEATAPDGIGAASADLVATVLADPSFMRALAGT